MNKKEYLERELKRVGYSGKIVGFSKCKKCGLCCLRNACSCAVSDFDEITVESIEKIIDSGKYMITASYTVNEKGFPIKAVPHISAREVNSPKNGVNITMIHSKCAMLTDNGCALTEDDRPSQGLLLIPIGEDCKAFMDTPTEQWKPYMHILDQVVIKRTGKSSQQLFEDEFPNLANRLKRKVQMSILYNNNPIEFAEYQAIDLIEKWGYYHAMYGTDFGNMIRDFIDSVKVKPY